MYFPHRKNQDDRNLGFSRKKYYFFGALSFFGFELSLMAMKANNGEINLMRSIEKFILSI